MAKEFHQACCGPGQVLKQNSHDTNGITGSWAQAQLLTSPQFDTVGLTKCGYM